MSRRVHIETYGCQMNLADSELMLGHLKAHGIERADGLEDADVVLVNTCAIREHAEERVVGRLTQLLPHKLNRPEVQLGLVGCMAQHHRARLLERLPFLDLILGPDEYRKLPELLGRETSDGPGGDPMVEVRLGRDETYEDVAPARADGVRAWITAMRGCDKFCSFCVVPYTRGRERSLPLPKLLEQAQQAADEGFREVVFLGQTVNAYRDGDLDFADLLRATAEIEGIERIRFTSPHPSDMSERLIETMGSVEKICPQLHLPLQSASNRVLESMRRGYTIEDYDALVERLRRAVPGIEFSTDIIVGFPGETREDFEATRAAVERFGYDQAFLFAYSPREGTRSFDWETTIPEAEKKARLAELIEVQEAIVAQRSRSWIGRSVEVLVEGAAKKQAGWLAGKTREFRTVVFPGEGIAVGDIVELKVTEATAHTLIADAAAAALVANG